MEIKLLEDFGSSARAAGRLKDLMVSFCDLAGFARFLHDVRENIQVFVSSHE
jgi:hypothetical protein